MNPSKPILKTKFRTEVQPVPPSGLDLLWLDVLALVLPYSSQVMLRQQCRLLAFDGLQARIGTTSPHLFKMANSRMSNLELAFERVFSRPIQTVLEVVPVVPAVTAPPDAIAPPKISTDLPQSVDWLGSMAESRRDYGFFT